ncbi:MAG: iron-sulfur cluster assembly protein [Candidatus Methanomethyliaceae archaeon]|nr:iron-sulfur cluster assembly protein [Candidatus Methanomethyliaceae archaeon]MDW7971427.1 iron-sulfur cluster assembly protein [Nitrososphaerota archaeon]
MKIEDKIMEALKEVMDPETGMSVVDMQLISKIEEKEGEIHIEFVPSSPLCPIAFYLAEEIKRVASKVEGVNKVRVSCKGHIMEEEISRLVNEE